MNNVNIKLDVLPLVRNIDFCISNKPFVHPNRILNYHVMLYILKGQMRIWEENIEYIVNAGDIFFLKSNLHHWGIEKVEPDTRWYYIHFYQLNTMDRYTLYDKFSTYIKKQEFEPSDYKYFISLPKKVSINTSVIGIENRFKDLLSLYHSSNNLRSTTLSIALMDFLLEFYLMFEEMSCSSKAKIHTEKMITYLEQNSSSDLSTKGLSEHMCMSYKYLCLLFKRQTGMSIVEYHTNLRINEAARLLRETQMNVSEVGFRVGFSDPFYFSNVFKKVKGMSPTKYLSHIS